MAERGLNADECRIGRAALGLGEADLAEAADMSVESLAAFEQGGDVEGDLALRLAQAFAALGVTFHPTPDGGSRMRARTLDGIIEAPVPRAR
jgi:transcriptional regulator with XRE-family HTH domain